MQIINEPQNINRNVFLTKLFILFFLVLSVKIYYLTNIKTFSLYNVHSERKQDLLYLFLKNKYFLYQLLKSNNRRLILLIFFIILCITLL